MYISPKATIGKGVIIGENTCIYGSAVIGDRTILENGVIIGHPSPKECKKAQFEHIETQASLDQYLDDSVMQKTYIGPDSVIRSGSVIYSGCSSVRSRKNSRKHDSAETKKVRKSWTVKALLTFLAAISGIGSLTA